MVDQIASRTRLQIPETLFAGIYDPDTRDAMTARLKIWSFTDFLRSVERAFLVEGDRLRDGWDDESIPLEDYNKFSDNLNKARMPLGIALDYNRKEDEEIAARDRAEQKKT